MLMQIIQIQEDLSTIEKSMEMLKSIQKNPDPQTLNQIGRWINSKEEHAQNIQNITSEYFLTQRIKTNTDNYNKKIVILHKLLLSAMKCKQTVEIKKCYSMLRHFWNHFLNFTLMNMDLDI